MEVPKMNKENFKNLLYKVSPIALASLIGLNIVFFLFGYVAIANESINVASIFSHLGNISTLHDWSNGATVSLFVSSILFILVLIGLIVIAVFSALSLRLCILTKTTDFKQEYITKLRNNLILSAFITACFIGFVSFLATSNVSALAVIMFILVLIALTSLKVLGFYFENLALSEIIAKSAKVLLLNVIYLVLGAKLLLPCLDMIVKGYGKVSYLVPSDSTFGAFYLNGLVSNLLVGVICFLSFGVTLALFFINSRNDHVEGPVNRRIVKSSFILFLLLTAAFLLTFVIVTIASFGALNLTASQWFNSVRATILPALLLSAAGLIFFALDFKAIRDAE